MQDRIVLAAGGDVSLGRSVNEQVRQRGSNFVFGAMAEALRQADLFTANFESPVLAAGKEPPQKGLVIPEALLSDLGLPVPAAFTMANNHVFDAGEDGVEFTRRRLEALGYAAFGAGADAETARQLRVVEVKGLRVGFLGRTEDCPQLKTGRAGSQPRPFDESIGPRRPFAVGPAECASGCKPTGPGPALINRRRLLGDVAEARASDQADVLVVHLHQGLEFVDWPAPRLVDLARALVEAGADLVLCHHPHVPQGWERYRNRLIFYSLGNLAFDVVNSAYLRNGSPWTNRSFLALIPVGPGEVGEPTLVPYRLSELGRPTPLAGAEAEDLLAHVAEISKALADPEALKARWRETCIRCLGINIDWALGAWKSDTREELLNSFFARFGYDEMRGWIRDLFGQFDWPKRLAVEPWEDTP